MGRAVSALLIFSLTTAVTAQQGALDEAGWEQRFKAMPDPQRMRANMERLSAHPHHVGSPYDKENAEWILAQYKQWGWDAHIEEFQVLFPTPKLRVLEMVSPTTFTAKLEEPAVAVDPTSKQKDEQLPTYNAYSPDGDVTAPLVYVNYGVLADYDELARHGVSVKGAIVIARYGQSWRGIKPKLAAEHGAIGCIIYSDPAEDGYSVQEPFPKGPMRPPEGVQRGSVLDGPLYPGDPLTPGVGATQNAKRLALKDAPSLAKIPVLPISYADAQPLLAALEGPVAPANWRGALPITYRMGPGPAKVHLKLAFNWDLKPVYDVIATMRGSEEPDLWVLRGNHHDAWVNGADDPVSGQVVLLEEARALGELARQGWKPKRTIIYASWDGEEPMLLGSTEWVEQHADELKKHAAIYINTDANSRGYLGVEGSHSLQSLMNAVAKDVEDPESKVSVFKRQQANLLLHGTPKQQAEARSGDDLSIGPLGSGSDYSGFIDHLGVASVNLDFDGEDPSGNYHSIYDDFYWYTHFSDYDFVFGRALAQTAGLTVLRMADAEIMPYDFEGLSRTVAQYIEEVKALLETRRKEAEAIQQNLRDGVYAAANDPRNPTFAPAPQEIPPYLNFAPLDNAAAALDRAAKDYSNALAGVKGKPLPADRLETMNQELAQAERKLTIAQGLPRRPWMQHVLYAPGWYTGYGAKTLPGVREGIEQGRYREAEEQAVLAAGALQDEAAWIEQIAKQLEQ
ncbi:MAG TPA: transferrin receptor-like dimerization domain-containing protein [Acidobacteriaceae bacterium]|nr:transferrin receptor-like dimerization domain-containing protein [Acidobacteriaceae bacterium]